MTVDQVRQETTVPAQTETATVLPTRRQRLLAGCGVLAFVAGLHELVDAIAARPADDAVAADPDATLPPTAKRLRRSDVTLLVGKPAASTNPNAAHAKQPPKAEQDDDDDDDEDRVGQAESHTPVVPSPHLSDRIKSASRQPRMAVMKRFRQITFFADMNAAISVW